MYYFYSIKIKKFRSCRKSEGKDNILKSSEPVIKKKTITIMTLKPTHSSSTTISRPRAKSLSNGSILQGSFGSICRKLFYPRRRKSVSITSMSSDNNDKQPASSMITYDNNDYYNNVPNFNKACGQQANSPEMPIENGEVEELSEYFEHFVNIKLKMSSQAESMYV